MTRVLPLLLVLAACNRNQDLDSGEEVVDNRPLNVEIDDPQDEQFSTEAAISVSGKLTGPSGYLAYLNGADLVDAEGSFTLSSEASARPWADSPIWPVLAHAEEPSGLWMRDRITLMAGASVDAAATIPDALAFRLTDVLLLDVKPILEQEIANLDLAEQVVNSTITSFEYDELLVTELDFKPSGLNYTLTATNVVAEVNTSWVDNPVEADEVRISGVVTFGVDATGAITATAGEVTVAFTNLTFGGTANSFYEGLLNALIGPALGPTIGDQLTAALADLLVFQDQIRDLDFSGVHIHTDFRSALHDQDGVTLFGESTVSTDAGPLTGLRLSNPNPKPMPIGAVTTGGVAYDAGLYLDDDLISGLGAGLKQGGLLEQELSGNLGGLTLNTTLLTTFVEAFEDLPEDQPVTIRTRPTAVPSGGPSPGSPEAARLHVGGLALDFWTDADGDGAEDLVLTAMLDLVLGLEGGENLIDVTIAASQATVVSTILDIEDPSETETKLAGVLEVILPSVLGDALSAVALDGIEVVDSRPAGVERDYAGLYIDLDVEALMGGSQPTP